MENSAFKNEDFRLHFHPVLKTLSIFKDKHNNNKTKEVEMKRTIPDWE
ncbi:hypothetical protein M33023_02740 [Candidatus Phytoplasma asteris]|uniref:Uncharacterized protein n=1 Tax=Candidatus Phytoplasma asteris TaxID=85620 RepID=A0ABZ2YGP5_9MOLU|nr:MULTISPECIES: hypothetical protein [16SrI (Aster yellows group)]